MEELIIRVVIVLVASIIIWVAYKTISNRLDKIQSDQRRMRELLLAKGLGGPHVVLYTLSDQAMIKDIGVSTSERDAPVILVDDASVLNIHGGKFSNGICENVPMEDEPCSDD